jgi:RNA polymerase sigma factor (sigma-70 family)
LDKGPVHTYNLKELDKNGVHTYNLKELDKNGFVTVVYNRYGKKLYSYAIKSWNLNEDTAWDLIYKTIYKVLDSYNNYTFESEEKFASFIFKIFINYLRNHYRDNSKAGKALEFTAMDDVDMSTKGTTEALESSNKKLLALNEALDEMQDWERMLLLMRSEGRAYSEIATYIDKPENQLKVYYQRLKEQITKKLNGRS